MPRFVVLEHLWNGVHWDLMLEHAGTLRTWAIDEEPTYERDLPARSLPDHRLDYLDYEGPVSQGRGRVRRFDGGVYRPIRWEPHHVRVALRGVQLAGDLELRRSDLAASRVERWIVRLSGNVA